MRRFELLVFDWDGTLMDSQQQIVQCIQAAAADLGLSVPSHAAASNIIGLGLTEAIEQLFPGQGAALRQDMVQAYRRHFLDAGIGSQSRLFEGAEAVLNELGKADYLLAVATGKSRSGLIRVFEHTGLGDLFDYTRCADETFSKPHPAMLEEIMERLGVLPEATLMIGDTEYDLQMAANAGVAAVGVSYGAHEPERLLRHGPLVVLNHIRDLPGWLRAQGGAR